MNIVRRALLLTLSALALPACDGDPQVKDAEPNFTMVAPANTAFGVSGTPTFSWDPSIGATSYTVQVSTDSAFSNFVVNQGGITETSLSPSVTLTPGTVYYWRVIADTPNGMVSANAAPFTFTTVAPTPGAFTMVGPSNGTSGITAAPTFSWNPSVGAASYRLQIATDPGFGSFVLNQGGIAATSFTPTVTLAPSTPHFWRVLAESSNTVTATGAPWGFTTGTASAGLPGAFTLTSPTDFSAGVSSLPNFSWAASTGATSYRLQVARDAAFNTIVVDQSGLTSPFFTLNSAPLLPGTMHFWRVQAVNPGGTTMSSAPFSFTTF